MDLVISNITYLNEGPNGYSIELTSTGYLHWEKNARKLRDFFCIFPEIFPFPKNGEISKKMQNFPMIFLSVVEQIMVHLLNDSECNTNIVGPAGVWMWAD